MQASEIELSSGSMDERLQGHGMSHTILQVTALSAC